MSEAPDILVVEGLARNFGAVRAVADASFTARRAEITGLIGPNGAGKSTVLSMVAGALRPAAGSIRFEGRQLEKLPAHRVAGRGVIRTFQLAGMLEHLTVLENLLVARPMRGETFWQALLGKRFWRDEEMAAVERGRALLDRFELRSHENEYAGNLSGGQKRLVELMRALMADPKLLLLDEPMSGVSPSLVPRIEAHLQQLRQEGLSVLMVEHSLGVVDRLCDLVVVMSQGRTIAVGTMAEVRSRREVLDAYLVG
jgi:ABC-type branched-subunit amino acid transport system ATPase component